VGWKTGQVRRAQSLGAGPVVGAVLAGGGGRRIGGSKPTVELAGRPLLSYPLSAVERAGLAPLVVAKAATELPALDLPVVRERAEEPHPLHGVVAALARAGGRPVVAVACDMPLVTAELLAWLAGLDGTVLPVVGGSAQPLLARYAADAGPVLGAAARRGLSAQDAVTALGPRIIEEAELAAFGDPRRLFLNVNDERDLQRAAALVAKAPL
jgi:molybdopterin-guanine dinucleotide biosynthesis protein A